MEQFTSFDQERFLVIVNRRFRDGSGSETSYLGDRKGCGAFIAKALSYQATTFDVKVLQPPVTQQEGSE